MSALLSLDGQLRRQYISFHVALVSVPIRLLAVKPKSVMRNFVHFAIKRLLLHSVFGVIVSVQFIVSFLHFHRAQVRGGVAGLQNDRAQVRVFAHYNAAQRFLLLAGRRKVAVSVQFRLAPLQNPLAVV